MIARMDAASPPVDSAPMGLTSEEAARLLASSGSNILPAPPVPPAWRQLGQEMVHFFALMLWAAGGLALLAGMPQLGIAIFVVVVVNAVFAFAQEHRAERAAQRLRSLLPARVMVIRDGKRLEIDAQDLVPGDLVELGAGSKVPADLRIIEAHSLEIDTSTMTGESVPVPAERDSTALAGTFVVSGEATGLVTATGMKTELAVIARLTRAGRRPRSPLARELDRVVRIVALVAVGVGVGFFGIALLLGTSASDGFLFAIGVTVALVPEGLLPTVTLSLAMGAQRMAHRNALVRRLESVETLGSTTFICTDKTGTLTRNEMAVVRSWTPSGSALIAGTGYEPVGDVTCPDDALPALRKLADAGLRCSTGQIVPMDGGWKAQGDPMEAAIDAFWRRLGGVPDGSPNEPTVRRFPFDARRRRMSVVTSGRVLVKGAPEAVLPLCLANHDAAGALDEMVGQALRVLAVAERTYDVAPTSSAEAEQGLMLLGLLGFEDPPREGTATAIAACRRAGIRVAMVTGDHPLTAAAIAREVGLLLPGSPVIEGTDLPDDEEALGALIDHDGIVISRVAPEQKLLIARALHARGHVVAMTGDGVNDGPALQEADVGIAMGRSGTDVAREASDLVLLDDDFATIVAAVEEGRATFANMRRFLSYHLTDNVAELTPFVVWALSGGSFPLALGVLQILCLDIGTDIFPALALGSEPPNDRVLARPLAGRHLIDRKVLTRVFGILGPVEAAVEMAAFTAALMAAGWRPGDAFPEGDALRAASGAAFTAVVLGQMANAFACRSTTLAPWTLGWRKNRLLVVAVATEALLLVGFLLIPPVASLLEHAWPPVAGMLAALAAIPAVLLADALHKRWRRWHRVNHQAGQGSPSLL